MVQRDCTERVFRQPMNKCQTCKWWGKNCDWWGREQDVRGDPNHKNHIERHRCLRILPLYECKPEPGAKPTDLAVTIDAEIYFAALLTNANFGCELWELVTDTNWNGWKNQ